MMAGLAWHFEKIAVCCFGAWIAAARAEIGTECLGDHHDDPEEMTGPVQGGGHRDA